MPLSSLIFIFVFLPVFLLLYTILRGSTWRNTVLLLMSLVFFGWADLAHLPLLLLVLLFNYVLGRLIGYQVEKANQTAARLFMWIAVAANMLVLVFYKYTGLLLETLSGVARINIPYEQGDLPLGISFFTFTGVAYILDVYNNSEKAVIAIPAIKISLVVFNLKILLLLSFCCFRMV